MMINVFPIRAGNEYSYIISKSIRIFFTQFISNEAVSN